MFKSDKKNNLCVHYVLGQVCITLVISVRNILTVFTPAYVTEHVQYFGEGAHRF